MYKLKITMAQFVLVQQDG